MVDILAIGAHPDDVELTSGGTLLAHHALGYTTAILDLTRGELGTRGTAELRDLEAAESARILGISERLNLGLKDGFFEADEASLLRVVAGIRYFKPAIVLANSISDRHPDHGRASNFISRACFLAGLPKIETKYLGHLQEAHRPKAVYHYIQDRYIKPDFLIDITPWYETKMAAILAFGSQFYGSERNEPQTPISSEEFLHFLEARSREFGRIIGVKYAEGFTVERAPAVTDLFALK